MHPVAERGGCLVEYIPPEVSLTPLPNDPREGCLQRLPQASVGVARSDIHAREAAFLEPLDKPAPRFASLAEGDLQSENLPLAGLANADRKHLRSTPVLPPAACRLTFTCMASSTKNG
jgi:hypothetical protein